jgi:CHAT domain-containing protein
MRRLLALILSLCAMASMNARADASIRDGSVLREQGNVQQSIDVLRRAVERAASPQERASAEGELGVSLLQARDFDAAAISLTRAHTYFNGRERARYAIHLGNLGVRRKLPQDARRFYEEALAGAGDDADLALNASLNLVRLAPPAERLARLLNVSQQLSSSPITPQSASLHLNLGHQAWDNAPADLRLAYLHMQRARELATKDGNHRLAVEADDALAALYETQGRYEEALALTLTALERARQPSSVQMADLLIALEWRQARLRERLGASDSALAAYERAAAQLKAIRDDIPIEYDNGRSSFRDTIAPLYLGYVGLMLKQADSPATLRQALDAVEQIKQAELQDYLGDRCSVETVQGGKSGALPAGVAVLYPIIFPDRIELLLETSRGITRRTSKVDEATLADTVSKLAFALRNGMNDFMPPARQLYDWLLRPFDTEAISTLVVVPDGALRLLPLSVLHDGERFAVEKFAVSTVTGMTMTNSASPRKQGVEALVVGISDPGPVVSRLSQKMANDILQPASSRSLGGLAQTRALRSLRAPPGGQIEDLRASLQLPGVKEEVKALARVLPGAQLLNAQFTVDRFRSETGDGAYRIIHIASHGVFGGSAESSFIMAYDDLLTMNGLQAILKSDKFARAPVELLSLSACETAEGNERAPLGMSGAAIKARAKSVLGTLWPLEDNAAQQVMTRFYGGLANGGLGKAEALRQAQLVLIRDPNAAHPFFWGSFILIGNWQ